MARTFTDLSTGKDVTVKDKNVANMMAMTPDRYKEVSVKKAKNVEGQKTNDVPDKEQQLKESK